MKDLNTEFKYLRNCITGEGERRRFITSKNKQTHSCSLTKCQEHFDIVIIIITLLYHNVPRIPFIAYMTQRKKKSE